MQTGAKGIGRFALDRIGDNCVMHTKSTTENLEWSVDWSLFKDGTPLTNISADLVDVEYSFDEFVSSAISDDFKKLVKEKFENRTSFSAMDLTDEKYDIFDLFCSHCCFFGLCTAQISTAAK